MYNQIFLIKWESGQYAMRSALNNAMIMWGEEQYAITT